MKNTKKITKKLFEYILIINIFAWGKWGCM